jgi:AhpD family alkylhydroperoxidase
VTQRDIVVTNQREPENAMPRLPYCPPDLAEPRELVSAIRARRGGALLNLDRMLLHSPPFASGWNGLLRAVRTELSLPARLRELAICAVAAINRADYELHHHSHPFLDAGGTAEQLRALANVPAAAADGAQFTEAERAVLRATLDITLEVRLSNDTYAALERCLANDRQVVELIGVVATYNMVSRFLVALGIEVE